MEASRSRSRTPRAQRFPSPFDDQENDTPDLKVALDNYRSCKMLHETRAKVYEHAFNKQREEDRKLFKLKGDDIASYQLACANLSVATSSWKEAHTNYEFALKEVLRFRGISIK